MKLKVNQDVCIGCGACAAICTEVFDINEDGLAIVTVEEIKKENEEDALDAKEGCPTGAIVEEDTEANEQGIEILEDEE